MGMRSAVAELGLGLGADVRDERRACYFGLRVGGCVADLERAGCFVFQRDDKGVGFVALAAEEIVDGARVGC